MISYLSPNTHFICSTDKPFTLIVCQIHSTVYNWIQPQSNNLSHKKFKSSNPTKLLQLIKVPETIHQIHCHINGNLSRPLAHALYNTSPFLQKKKKKKKWNALIIWIAGFFNVWKCCYLVVFILKFLKHFSVGFNVAFLSKQAGSPVIYLSGIDVLLHEFSLF